MKVVQLTDAEIKICEWVGKQRYAAALRRGRDPGAGPSKEDQSPTNHIRGAQCEFAGSIMLNLYWRPSVDVIDAIDVGGLVEVRSTVLDYGRLIVKPDATNTSPYMLVKCKDATFTFCGWIMAGAAKQTPLIAQHGDPAHFVPQRDLHDFASLNDLVTRMRRCSVA